MIFFVSLNVYAENTNPVVRAVMFDFGRVIANANTTKMVIFLIDSFNINKDELSND